MRKLPEEERRKRNILRIKRWYDKKRENGELKQYYKDKYQKHREYTRQQAKEHYIKNKEEILKKEKQSYHTDIGYSKKVLAKVKAKCRNKNIDFNLTEEDIFVPDACPILGIKLEKGVGASSDNSPSLDRINSNDGYVKGNVMIISHKANRIKNNGNLEELRKIVLFLESLE